MHRIDIEVVGHNSRGPVYRVDFAGEVLIDETRVPEFDASRELLRPGRSTWDLAVDIERGAGLTVEENATTSSNSCGQSRGATYNTGHCIDRHRGATRVLK